MTDASGPVDLASTRSTGPGASTPTDHDADGLVVVVGSANLDVVGHVERRPAPGETVLGTDYTETPGGKGLNQAVAAARLGHAALVAAVGDDQAGDLLRAHLERHGVDVSHLATVDAPTGRALITVTPDGENSIVVAALANGLLTPAAVTMALDRLRPQVVLVQREIPPAAVAAAAAWAKVAGAVLVLNPSPVAGTPPELLARTSVLVANVHEARTLLGTQDDGPALAAGLAALCPGAVVTAGGGGCWVAQGGRTAQGAQTAFGGRTAQGARVEHVPALRGVVAVDTTGAGDAFAGTLAARLAQGAELVEAVRQATAVAGRLVGLPRDRR